MATLVEMREIARDYERELGSILHYAATVTDATSDVLRVPANAVQVAVAVHPGTDALVQYTLSAYDAIEADTANWIDWPKGTITTSDSDVIEGRVAALRMTSTGASDWEVTA